MKKKTLSLLLVLAMVLGSFSFAFAAEEPAAMTEAEAGEFLKKAGVLEGNDAGDLMLDKALKRQDMVVLFSRLLGQEEEAKTFDGQPTFKDIRDKYYNPYLAWGQANKLIEGHTEERFGYNEEMTAQQYVTILLRALGYGEEAKDYDNVVAKAKELGLLKDVKVEKDTKITRGQMSVMTMNALGTNLKGEEKTLADKLNIELPAPPVPEKLEVKEVVADNLKEIKVVFNKAVDRDVVEDKDLYNTTAGSIKDIELEDENTIVLTLADGTVMTNKKEYKLTIRGFKDAGSEVNNEFKFKAYDNTVPEVVEVVGLGTKAVKVVMSEPIKEAKSSNFKVDGKTYYGSVKVDGREIVLKPYGSSFTVGDHKLLVATLEDYADFKSIEKEVEFSIVEDKEVPTVVEVKGTLERVVVTFSEDVDDVTVTKDSLYWGGVKSNKAQNVVKLSGNRYAFEFSKEKALPTYEVALTIKGVKDYSGNEMDSTEVPFKAEIDQTRPEVLDAYADDETTIIVEFNKSVDKIDAEKSANYTLTDEDGKKVSLKNISCEGKEVTITLYSALKEDKDYTFKISGIRDNTKLANSMLPYETTISAGSYNRPHQTSVIGNDADRTIFVSFSKKMDVETIADPTNYLVKVEGKQYLLSEIGADVDVLQDGKAVLLTLPKKIGGKLVGTEVKFGTEITKIVILAVKDLAGNNFKDYGAEISITTNEFSYATEPVEATAVDANTVELKFKRPVVEARIADFDSTVKIAKVDSDGSTTVVITFEDDIKADLSNLTLKIKADNKIESITGEHYNVGVTAITLAVDDEIAPSLEKATANKVGTDLVIVATFDEVLDNTGLLGSFAKSDFVITRVDGKKISLVDATSTISGKAVTIRIPGLEFAGDDSENGYAYGVEVVKPAYVRDASSNNNLANATDVPEYTNDLDVAADDAAAAKEAAKTTLTAAIAAANTLHDGADEGTAVDKYVVGSKETFKTAIEAAEAILADAANKTAEELNAAVGALDSAKATFEAKKITALTLTDVSVTVSTTDDTTTVTLAEGETIEVTSSETEKVTVEYVDGKVEVTGVAAGTSTITVNVKDADGDVIKIGTFTVTVE